MNAATWLSLTIVKRRITMTHPNKDEPKAQGQLFLVSAFHVQSWKSEVAPLRNLQIILYLNVMNAATWPSPGQFKKITEIKHIKKIFSLKKSISSAIVGLAISCVNFKVYWFSIWFKFWRKKAFFWWIFVNPIAPTVWSDILCNSHVQTTFLHVTNVTITFKVKMYLHIWMAILFFFVKTYNYVQIMNKTAAQCCRRRPFPMQLHRLN